MAYIRRNSIITHPKTRSNLSGDRKYKLRTKIYGKKQWKELRENKLMNSPLCEICKHKGINKLATEVHHKDSFLNYSYPECFKVAFDYDNLLSLCNECHMKLHGIIGTTNGQTLEELSDIIDEYYEKRDK